MTALQNARSAYLTLGAGILAAGALYFTSRNYRLSREGHVTDRYTKAIEQLGSDKIDVRLGGIYALERIALDSPRDHPTIMEVLAAFLREHAAAGAEAPQGSSVIIYLADQGDRPAMSVQEEEKDLPGMPQDVRAAITVIARRDHYWDSSRNRWQLDLEGARLVGADLGSAVLIRSNLAHANLNAANLNFANLIESRMASANLVNAGLERAVLRQVDLREANLEHARLRSANLDTATLIGANLAGANLEGANLTYAHLGGANLKGAVLSGTKLVHAVLDDADLTGAFLIDADLTDVHLENANLTGAFLQQSKWNNPDPPPKGWRRDSGGQLWREWSDTNPFSAEGPR